jgi:hypothetical protein
MLPKFNFLLAGGAVVLSIIAITDNVGSNTATVTKPAAVTATVQKPGTGTARPEHASKVATVAAVAPAVVPRLMDESRLASEIGTKVAAAAPLRRLHEPAEYITGTPAAQQVSAAAGTCGLKISTNC